MRVSICIDARTNRLVLSIMLLESGLGCVEITVAPDTSYRSTAVNDGAIFSLNVTLIDEDEEEIADTKFGGARSSAVILPIDIFLPLVFRISPVCSMVGVASVPNEYS